MYWSSHLYTGANKWEELWILWVLLMQLRYGKIIGRDHLTFGMLIILIIASPSEFI